jgi:hypothetical protein
MERGHSEVGIAHSSATSFSGRACESLCVYGGRGLRTAGRKTYVTGALQESCHSMCSMTVPAALSSTSSMLYYRGYSDDGTMLCGVLM